MKLDEAINNEVQTLRTQLNTEFLSAIESFGSSHTLFPVSSTYGYGMEDIYNVAQQVFHGGEDLEGKQMDN